MERKLLERPMMTVASPWYLKKYGTPTHPKQLKHLSWLIANNDHWRFSEGQDEITIKVQGRWRSNNVNALVQACEEDLGIAYLPKSSFSNGIELQKLVPILNEYWSNGVSSWIVYQNKRFLPLRARLAIDFLLERFKDFQE